ncbi:MAG: exodeoxyribonuclease VII large subunit [Pirellulales bacterium]|nr:exodeoxyribonuclease VII large subunit [Pirellulales bacterium]
MPDRNAILTVSELTAGIKELLETALADVWVSGEIADFARPRSGHCYFTLKDDQSQLRAVLWRSAAARARFDLVDGLEVVCRGHLDVYAPRGSYQLIVESIEPRGWGALELALRQLREKLAREGLFDPARKRPLPRAAQRLAIITSPTGAALRDFLQVLTRRWRGADVLVVPVPVQGQGAAQKIARAIETVNRLRPRPDCAVLTRGGGSLEDLWAFNEEPLVRAIAASEVVTVSAVGHEIDVTLADLAADVRAATPSEAAELVAPAADDVALHLARFQRRLRAVLLGRIESARSRLRALAASRVLRRPKDRLDELSRRLDEWDARAGRAVRRRIERARRDREALAARLESLSPLAVLARGYSLTQRAADGSIIRDAAALSPGEVLRTLLAHGHVASRVERIEK